MATVTLQMETRTGTGKGVARKLRADKKLPAILYGRSRPPLPLAIDAYQFQRALSTGAKSRVVLRLEIEGQKEDQIVAIVRDLQVHPVSRQVVHADLLAIRLDQPLEVQVPLRPLGTPVGVKIENGVLEWIHREVEIRVLPTQIPDSIEVDVSGLHVGQGLHLADLEAEAFEFVGDPQLPLCTVGSTALEEVVVPVEEEVEGEGAAETEGETAGEEGPEAPEQEG